MPGSSQPGPLGSDGNTPAIDEGTRALTTSPRPAAVGANSPVTADAGAGGSDATTPTDPEIESLGIRGSARRGAYALKKAHPSVKFTSGRRDTADQARAMASNVVENRHWIEETYVSSTVSKACQKWVNDNRDKKTKEEIAAGLLSVMDAATDADLAKLSKHLSGDAFDMQPVTTDAEAIKQTIRGLEGLDKFLEKEGGLVRWHAQF